MNMHKKDYVKAQMIATDALQENNLAWCQISALGSMRIEMQEQLN